MPRSAATLSEVENDRTSTTTATSAPSATAAPPTGPQSNLTPCAAWCRTEFTGSTVSERECSVLMGNDRTASLPRDDAAERGQHHDPADDRVEHPVVAGADDHDRHG